LLGANWGEPLSKGNSMKYFRLIAALSACVATSTIATAQIRSEATPAKPTLVTAPAPTPLQVPPAESLVIMIRTSLVALTQANTTNNYTVLSAIGSPNFRQANPPQRLAQVFEPFRKNNIDLGPVTFVAPQLSSPARIENGRLRIIGFFPTAPMQVDYDLTYEPVGGAWQLFGLSVNLRAQQNAAPPR
jgi:hypothetical protein